MTTFLGHYTRRAIAGFVVLLSSFVSCTEQPILLGFAGPLTGGNSDLGVQGRNGAMLAVEEINRTGGVAGRMIELVARDDGNSPELATEVDRELCALGVVAIIGHMTSEPSVAAASEATARCCVLVSPTASTPRLSGIDDCFFRVQGATDATARVFGRYVADHMTIERLTAVYDRDNAGYSEPFVAAFFTSLQQNSDAVLELISFSGSGGIDPAALVTEIEQTGPEAVLIVASATETAALVQAIRAAGADWQLLSSGWAATPALASNAGAAVNGLYLARATDSPHSPADYAAFAHTYRTRFGREPSFAAAQSYDAVRLVARALEQNSGSEDGLADALERVEPFDGLLLRIDLDAFGDVAAPVTVFRFVDGTATPVFTPEDD